MLPKLSINLFLRDVQDPNQNAAKSKKALTNVIAATTSQIRFKIYL